MKTPSSFDFVVDSKNYIYINAPENNFLFNIYSEKGEIISKFGSIFKYEYQYHQNLGNLVKFVIDSDDNIYCVFKDHPIIRKYDKNQNLIIECEISNIIGLQKQISFWKERNKKSNNPNYFSSKSLVRDMSIDEKYLYVSFPGEEDFPVYVFDKNNLEFEKKVVLNKYKNEVVYTKFYDLSSGFIYTYDFREATLLQYQK